MDNQETLVNDGNRQLQGASRHAEGARAIARVSEPQALSTRVLEDRRLIHRNDSVRAQAEAFRELRTRLLALGEGQNFVTLVAPISHRSGGSFVARNLAAAFAFDETKTALLVDCDARYPSQHSALSVDPADGGLMDYLHDTAFDLASIVYRTGIPRLHLIPSGRRVREASGESFSAFRMRAVVDSLRSQQADRYLILDGPAVQGSPDARILSDLADFVVLVAGYGRTTMQEIEKSAASFAPEKLAGIVFNNGI